MYSAGWLKIQVYIRATTYRFRHTKTQMYQVFYTCLKLLKTPSLSHFINVLIFICFGFSGFGILYDLCC